MQVNKVHFKIFYFEKYFKYSVEIALSDSLPHMSKLALRSYFITPLVLHTNCSFSEISSKLRSSGWFELASSKTMVATQVIIQCNVCNEFGVLNCIN